MYTIEQEFYKYYLYKKKKEEKKKKKEDKTWKMAEKNTMHGKNMEFEKSWNFGMRFS